MGILDLEKKTRDLLSSVTVFNKMLRALNLLPEDITVYRGKKFVNGVLTDDPLTVAVDFGTGLSDYGISINADVKMGNYIGTLEIFDANNESLYRKTNVQIHNVGRWFTVHGANYFNFTFKTKTAFEHFDNFIVFMDDPIAKLKYQNFSLKFDDNDGIITATNIDTDDVYTIYPQDGGTSGITVINDPFSMAELLSACLNFDPGIYNYYTTVACTDKATWVTANTQIVIYNPTGQYQDVRVEIIKQQGYGTAYMTSNDAWTYTSIR